MKKIILPFVLLLTVIAVSAQCNFEELELESIIPSLLTSFNAPTLGSYDIYLENINHDSPIFVDYKNENTLHIKDLTANLVVTKTCLLGVSCMGPDEILGKISIADIVLQEYLNECQVTDSEFQISDVQITSDTFGGSIIFPIIENLIIINIPDIIEENLEGITTCVCDNEVPEFTTIGAIIALLGAGLIIEKRIT